MATNLLLLRDAKKMHAAALPPPGHVAMLPLYSRGSIYPTIRVIVYFMIPCHTNVCSEVRMQLGRIMLLLYCTACLINSPAVGTYNIYRSKTSISATWTTTTTTTFGF